MFVYMFSAFDAVPVPFTGMDYTDMNSTTLANAYANAAANGALGEYAMVSDTDVYSGYIANVFTPISGLNIMAAIRYENNDFKGGKLWINDLPTYNQSAFSPKAGIVYEIIKDKFCSF